MKLIGIGDAVTDYYKDQGLFYPGGSVLNVAVSAKRNGAEASAYLGILGFDKAGDHIMDCLINEGVDGSRVRRVAGETGEATVTLNDEGDRIFVGTNRDVRVTSLVSLQLNQADLAYIQHYDIIHSCISINQGLEKELPKLRGKTISFDFSTRTYWTKAYIEQVCPYLSYAFFSGSDLSDSEVNGLIEDVHALGVRIVGITRGERPALFSENGERFEQRPTPIKVLDTMGAGDSFIGAFLANHGSGRTMTASLQAAADYAAQVCTIYGALGYGLEK